MSTHTPEPARAERPHRWLVSEDSAGLFPIRTGTTETAAQAWTLALAVARAALLDGRIRDFAIAVDDEIPTVLFFPGRDPQDRLNVEYLLHDLDELQHAILRDLPRAPAPTTP